MTVNRQNKVTADILCSAQKLVGIAQVGVGVDSIDLAGCRERQIAVTSKSSTSLHPRPWAVKRNGVESVASLDERKAESRLPRSQRGSRS